MSRVNLLNGMVAHAASFPGWALQQVCTFGRLMTVPARRTVEWTAGNAHQAMERLKTLKPSLGMSFVKGRSADDIFGLQVTDTAEGAPIDRAGIRKGNIIMSINQQPTLDKKDFFRVYNDIRPGDTLNVKVHDGQQILTVSVFVSAKGISDGDLRALRKAVDDEQKKEKQAQMTKSKTKQKKRHGATRNTDSSSHSLSTTTHKALNTTGNTTPTTIKMTRRGSTSLRRAKVNKKGQHITSIPKASESSAGAGEGAKKEVHKKRTKRGTSELRKATASGPAAAARHGSGTTTIALKVAVKCSHLISARGGGSAGRGVRANALVALYVRDPRAEAGAASDRKWISLGTTERMPSSQNPVFRRAFELRSDTGPLADITEGMADEAIQALKFRFSVFDNSGDAQHMMAKDTGEADPPVGERIGSVIMELQDLLREERRWHSVAMRNSASTNTNSALRAAGSAVVVRASALESNARRGLRRCPRCHEDYTPGALDVASHGCRCQRTAAAVAMAAAEAVPSSKGLVEVEQGAPARSRIPRIKSGDTTNAPGGARATTPMSAAAENGADAERDRDTGALSAAQEEEEEARERAEIADRIAVLKARQAAGKKKRRMKKGAAMKLRRSPGKRRKKRVVAHDDESESDDDEGLDEEVCRSQFILEVLRAVLKEGEGSGLTRRKCPVKSLSQHFDSSVPGRHPANVYRTNQGGNLSAVLKKHAALFDDIWTFDKNVIVVEERDALKRAVEDKRISKDAALVAEEIHAICDMEAEAAVKDISGDDKSPSADENDNKMTNDASASNLSFDNLTVVSDVDSVDVRDGPLWSAASNRGGVSPDEAMRRRRILSKRKLDDALARKQEERKAEMEVKKREKEEKEALRRDELKQKWAEERDARLARKKELEQMEIERRALLIQERSRRVVERKAEEPPPLIIRSRSVKMAKHSESTASPAPVLRSKAVRSSLAGRPASAKKQNIVEEGKSSEEVRKRGREDAKNYAKPWLTGSVVLRKKRRHKKRDPLQSGVGAMTDDSAAAADVPMEENGVEETERNVPVVWNVEKETPVGDVDIGEDSTLRGDDVSPAHPNCPDEKVADESVSVGAAGSPSLASPAEHSNLGAHLKPDEDEKDGSTPQKNLMALTGSPISVSKVVAIRVHGNTDEASSGHAATQTLDSALTGTTPDAAPVTGGTIAMTSQSVSFSPDVREHEQQHKLTRQFLSATLEREAARLQRLREERMRLERQVHERASASSAGVHQTKKVGRRSSSAGGAARSPTRKVKGARSPQSHASLPLMRGHFTAVARMKARRREQAVKQAAAIETSAAEEAAARALRALNRDNRRRGIASVESASSASGDVSRRSPSADRAGAASAAPIVVSPPSKRNSRSVSCRQSRRGSVASGDGGGDYLPPTMPGGAYLQALMDPAMLAPVLEPSVTPMSLKALNWSAVKGSQPNVEEMEIGSGRCNLFPVSNDLAVYSGDVAAVGGSDDVGDDDGGAFATDPVEEESDNPEESSPQHHRVSHDDGGVSKEKGRVLMNAPNIPTGAMQEPHLEFIAEEKHSPQSPRRKVDIEAIASTLASGTLVTKLPRKGKPRNVQVQLKFDPVKGWIVCWKRRKLLGSKMSHVLIGKKTRIFEGAACGLFASKKFRKHFMEAGDRCFTIVTDVRTLDLMCPTVAMAQMWLTMLHHIVGVGGDVLGEAGSAVLEM